MSSRGVDVKERRLKTIYDALDASNNKKAIQEAEKVLRKDPSCQTAKALKGLALFRGNRNMEASILLNELSNEQPCDEACLQAMTYYYRESGLHEKISEIYESAHKKKPNNEDIMTTLFMAHVRLMNFQRQHQIARDLHKLMPSKMPYFFWSVMSLFMQAKSADNDLGAKMYLPLAEKMVKKVIDEGKLKAEAEYELYLMILEEQEKFAESLNFLTTSPLTEKVLKDRCAVIRYELDYLRKLNHDFQLFVKAKEILKNNADDWAMYKEFLNKGISICKNNLNTTNGLSEPDADSIEGSAAEVSYPSLLTFIGVLRQENEHLRGPYLAHLLFIDLTSGDGNTIEIPDIGDPLDLMVEYFQRFGCKPVCPYDLAIFFDNLVLPRQAEFIERLEKSYSSDDGVTGDSKSPKTLDSMYKRLCIEMMIRKGGFHQKYSKEEREAKIVQLLDIHKHSLSFGVNLERTELQPADGFVLLVTLLLFDEWLEASRDESDSSQSILWRAVLTLETALTSSPCNHHLKLCLLKLYCLLGAYQSALSTFQSLEIKHIQYDSLGYLISKPGLYLASFSAALGVWNNVVKFFAVNRKDMMEYLVSAYRSGSFRKIPEFVDFHKRLSNSFEYHNSDVELRLQTVLSNSSKFDELLQTFSDLAYDVDKAELEYDSLVDGRDFRVTVGFEPKAKSFTEEDQEKSFKEEIRWIRLRDLTTQSFAVGCKLIMEGNKYVFAQESKESSVLKNGGLSEASLNLVEKAFSILSQLDRLKEETGEQDHKIIQSSLLAPYSSANSLYIHGCYCEALRNGLNLVIYMNKVVQDPEAYDAAYESSLKENLLESIRKAKDDIVQSKGRPHAETLTRLVCLSESLSIVTIFLMSVQSLFTRFRRQRSKKKKKSSPATEATSLMRSMTAVDSAMTSVCEVSNELKQQVEEWQELWKTISDLDKCLKTFDLPLKQETIESVRNQVIQSYCSSLNELSRMLEYVSARGTPKN